MKKQQQRGFLVTAGALITSALLALGGATAANADAQPVPESTPVTITKLAQPDILGTPATGEEITDLQGYDRIGGVVFNFYLVEETGVGGDYDIGTNDGQAYAAGLTAQTAPVGSAPMGSFDPTHSTQGATTATLQRGLYLIKEDPSTVPAGVTASAPFLLPVPLTDPTDLNAWLDHIYVYPKNSQLDEPTKTVENADNFVVGDEVTWTIKTDIPRVANPNYDADATPEIPQFIAPDLFRIDDTLNADELEFVSAIVSAGGTELAEGTHYDITPVDVLENSEVVAITHQILFTEQGRDALAAAVNADPNAQVTVELTTKVLAAEVIDNVASIYPNSDSVTVNKPHQTPSVDVKYGSVDLKKTSSNEDLTDLSGAQFRVYLNYEDAVNDTDNGGSADNYLNVSPTDATGEGFDIWTTKTDGSFSIEGLRYSGYADGEEFDDSNSRYQTYWLVEVTALDDHQLLAEPLEITITGDRVGDGFEITNQENTGGFVLPLTGGMGTAFLTIGGIAILAVVLLVARSRRNDEVTAE